MTEYPSVALGEVAFVRSGFAFKSGDWAVSGVPVVKIGNVKDGRLSMDGCSFVPLSVAASAPESVLTAGDILIAMTGYIGDVALVRESDLPVVVNQRVGRFSIRDPGRLDAGFLFYLLRASAVRSEIEGLGYGSAQPNVSPSLIHRVKVPLPPLPAQHAIARILGALDDKIDLNRRMNQTLEAIARALFKSWFVDFDPVRAKSEGRDPGLPSHLACLFPDSFEDSELGEIPAGWQMSQIGDEVQTLLGGTPSRAKREYWGGDIPWINSGKANEFRIIDPSEFITQAGLDSSATKLLPPRTTVIAITGATLGQVSLTEIQTCANQSIVGVIGSASLPGEFVYPWVKTNVERLISSQTGGAQQHINKNNVNELRVLCPPVPVIGAYVDRVRPIFDRIREGCFETRHLADLRDGLLPKLMGGEIRTGLAGPEILGTPG